MWRLYEKAKKEVMMKMRMKKHTQKKKTFDKNNCKISQEIVRGVAITLNHG